MADNTTNKTTEKKETATIDPYSEHETISSVTRISAILRPLMNKHSLISASIPGANSSFSTVLLNVNPDDGNLIIDELNPKGGHELLLQSKKITLQIFNEGAEINFSAQLISTGEEKGIAYYKIEFPKAIRYLQRRDTFRVPVSAAKEITIEVTAKDKTIFLGELHDISTGGMCIRFPKKQDMPLNLEHGEVQCIITLQDKKKIKCVFNICHTSVNKEHNRLFVGGNFSQLDKVQRRAIEKFVAELQRKGRQKMSRQ